MTKYDVSEILCLIFLYLCSREDYRYKALTVHKIGIFGCAGLVYTLAADTMSVQSMMAGERIRSLHPQGALRRSLQQKLLCRRGRTAGGY